MEEVRLIGFVGAGIRYRNLISPNHVLVYR
jgi:hypothetical protein